MLLVEKEQLEVNKAIATPRNHHVVVVSRNTFPGYASHNPMDTHNTLESTCAQELRI